MPDADEKLLQEVMFLIEAPFPVLCSFEKEFLELPKEVLVTTMKKHQKYFPVLDAQGRPLNYFIAVNNTDVIRSCRGRDSGHERVLRARLSDARFFFAEDQKKSLPGMTESLKNVLYQKQLGTSYEKMERFRGLAVHHGRSPDEPHDQAQGRACRISVQGRSCERNGRGISRAAGHHGPRVCPACRRARGDLPGHMRDITCRALQAMSCLPADVGAVVSIADKLDTIAGCFGVGLVPTGTADPYALRRQCLGIINIILQKKYTVSLADLVATAVELLAEKITRPQDEITHDVLAFFSGRLSNQLTCAGPAL